MAELATSVWLEKEGAPVCFIAGSTPPDWAAALITNPAAWVAAAGIPVETDSVDDESEETGSDEPEGSPVTDDEPAEVSIPSKAGPGSSASAWTAYALSKGFAVEDDAKASEIREALAAAGIPVE